MWSVRKYSLAYSKNTDLAKTSKTYIYAELLITNCITETVTTCITTLAIAATTLIVIWFFNILIFTFVIFYIFLVHISINLKICIVCPVINIYWSSRILNLIVIVHSWVREVIQIIYEWTVFLLIIICVKIFILSRLYLLL